MNNALRRLVRKVRPAREDEIDRRHEAAGALDDFLPEAALASTVRPLPPELVVDISASRSPWRTRGLIGLLVLGAASFGGFALYGSRPGAAIGTVSAASTTTGTVRVESNPNGVSLQVDGLTRGATPLTLSLPVGRHQLTLAGGGRTKTVSVDVLAGATSVHYLELPDAAAALATGSLQVTTSRPASVSIDGVARGTSPLVVDGLTGGEHQVVITAAGTTYRRTIVVDAGRTVSLVVGEMAGAVASGWMSARTPLPFTVAEDGRVVGTTETERIMLPAGAHTFEFRNDTLGFRATQDVRIDAGRVTNVALRLPTAPIQINALPWAEVWIDGERIGETPIANVMQPIGPHEIVFRHPQLGERRVNTMVTLASPARATVDMRTP